MRITILGSGEGSNFLSIHQAILEKRLDAEIVCVASNQPHAPLLEKAKHCQLPTYLFKYDPVLFPSEFFNEILTLNLHHQPLLWVLAGFMKKLPASMVRYFYPNIINIHPSLLPDFAGLNTHQRVLDAKHSTHGTTIHVVDEEIDHGPMLAQARLTVLKEDTASTLSLRVKALEHELYPRVLQDIAAHRILLPLKCSFGAIRR